MRLTVGRKMVGSFLIVALLLLSVAVVSYNAIGTLQEEFDRVAEVNEPVGSFAWEIRADQLERANLLQTMYIKKNLDALSKFDEVGSNQEKCFTEAAKLITDPESKRLMDQAKQKDAEYTELARKTISAISNGDFATVESLEVQEEAILTQFETASQQWIDYVDKDNAQVMARTDADAESKKMINLVLSGVALVLSVGLGIIISRSIAVPVNALSTVAAQISNGNLGVTVPSVKTRDEIQDLALSFDTMTHNLREMVKKISGTSDAVAATSEELSSNAVEASKATQQVARTIEQVAMGSTEQAKNASETADIINQVSQSIQQIAAGAQEQNRNVTESTMIVDEMGQKIDAMVQGMEKVKQVSEQNGLTATNGGQAVDKTVKGMLQLKEAVFDTAKRINELGDQSNRIGEIILVIDDIAEQTNLLALNAAIEAARAGEHGKGFAVVADEVRKLAERSGKATKEIAQLITEIQAGTKSAVESMQVGTRQVEEGVTLAQEAGNSLGEIVSGVKEAGSQVNRIMNLINEVLSSSSRVAESVGSVAAITQENGAATEQMSASAQQVDSSMQSVASISEENAAAAEEVSASTEELTASIEEISASSEQLARMAQDLQNIVMQFKL